jgi:hypothetical protein
MKIIDRILWFIGVRGKPRIKRDGYTGGWRVDYPGGEFYVIRTADPRALGIAMRQIEWLNKNRDWGD